MNWVTAFTIWLATQGIPVYGVSGQGVSATIWYQSSATTQQIATAEATKSTFVVPATPDLPGFINAINSDALVAGQPLLFQLGANLLPIFQTDMQLGNMVALQAHWNAAKATFGSTWLTTQVQTMLTGYASTYNIPLN